MKKKKDDNSISGRMKRYEHVTTMQTLVPTEPILIRVDGSAFHTFTRGMKRPFDRILMQAMQKTMVSMCRDVSTCKFGYTQSDEITLVCMVDDKIKTQGLYGYRLQKIVSKTAAKATRYFNKYFMELVQAEEKSKSEEYDKKTLSAYAKKFHEAEFDCRAHNIPEWDIINNIIWRQQDASTNSIESLAQSQFKHSELQNLNSSMLMDKLMLEKGINWNNMSIPEKRGSCCYKVMETVGGKQRGKWKLDLEMPIITKDRNFLLEILGIYES